MTRPLPLLSLDHPLKDTALAFRVMPAAAALLFAVVSATAGVLPLEAAAAPAGGCALGGEVADRDGSRSTMLMQFNVKQRKFIESSAGREEKKDQQPESNGTQAESKEPKANSALARILKRARENSRQSGMPLDYLLDVDYQHDANNPLDNDMRERGHRRRTGSPKQPGWPQRPRRTDRGPDKHLVLYECVTRLDERAASTVTSVAEPGSPCVFGADDRDEGRHCIMDGGEYGSFGWCYTAKDRSAWGSCNEHCPLSGPARVLERRIDEMDKLMTELLIKVKNKTNCKDSKKKRKKH